MVEVMSAETKWKLIAHNNDEYGPIDTTTVKVWIRERRISKDDLVCDVNVGRWMPVNNLDCFKSSFSERTSDIVGVEIGKVKESPAQSARAKNIMVDDKVYGKLKAEHDDELSIMQNRLREADEEKRTLEMRLVNDESRIISIAYEKDNVLQNLQNELNKKDVDMSALKYKMEKVERESEISNRQINRLNGIVSEKEAIIRDFDMRKEDMERMKQEVDYLKKQVIQRNKDMDDMRNERDKAQISLSEKEANLKELKHTHEEIKKELTSEKESNKKLQALLVSREEDLMQWKEELRRKREILRDIKKSSDLIKEKVEREVV